MAKQAQIQLGPITLTQEKLETLSRSPDRLDRIELLLAAALLAQSGASSPDDVHQAITDLADRLSAILPEASELVGASLQSLLMDVGQRMVALGDDDEGDDAA